jgi:predicted DCC family thiol-disulfide oxidoreductase YuxK
MTNKPIILFDGICNLCNSAVQYVIKHDPKAVFMFASLQSEAGQKLLKQYSLPAGDFKSFVLIMDNKAYSRSTAALKVTRHLKGVVALLYGFIIVPPFIRNAVYKLIADNRYKWFGKRNECMIPMPSLKERFLN